MQFDMLIVNGCSYMEQYALGQGHQDLATTLGIYNSASLSIGGSCNTRIIRTTLKHSYQTSSKCLYVIGTTFLSRTELPVLSYDPKRDLSFEGKWLSIQNSLGDSNTGIKGHMIKHDRDLDDVITYKDLEKFINIKLKCELQSVLDRIEDLQYKIISMISDLQSRGHDVIVFNQADDIFISELDNPRLTLLNHKRIIEKLKWRAVPWQYHSGTPMTGDDFEYGIPIDIRHPIVGAHQNLNNFLSNYIHETINS